MPITDPNAVENKALEKATKTLEEFAPEWKEQIEAAKDAEILAKIAVTARNAEDTEKAIKEDEDLLKLKEQIKTAREQYVLDRKVHKAKLFYAHYVLSARGK